MVSPSMRLFGRIIVVAVVSAAALLAAAISLWRVSALLPDKDGGVCFAGDFDPPRPIHLQTFGYDMRRGHFKQEQTGAVAKMRVEIRRLADDGNASQATATQSNEWLYIFSTKTVLADGRLLTTGATCPWGDGWVDWINPQLACFIDCEGGGVSAWRQAGRDGLSVRFESGEHLRMHGCGDAGVHMGADSEARSFPLDRVPQERAPT